MASDASVALRLESVFQVDQVLGLRTVELVHEDTQTVKKKSKTVLHRASEYNTFDLSRMILWLLQNVLMESETRRDHYPLINQITSSPQK